MKPAPISQDEYRQRRIKLLAQLAPDSIVILSAALHPLRNGDCHHPYRQDSNFHYLTGFDEPEAVIALIPGGACGTFIMFNRERDFAAECWDGPRLGQHGAKALLGADVAYSIKQLDEVMPELLTGKERVYYPVSQDVYFEMKLRNWNRQLAAKVRGGIKVPVEFINITPLLSTLRLIKSQAEIQLMRYAAQISALAHQNLMKICTPGMMEFELEAELLHTFYRFGSRHPAYSSIVGSGANGCVLHYTANENRCEAGDLVLVDAAAEYEYYAADITRTFPVNGRFSDAQRELYSLVLEAQRQTIAAVKPGTSYQQLQETAVRLITQGLVDLGILTGSVSELEASKAYKRFYTHNIGHWLGIDVHDVGSYQIDGKPRCLEPGMVLTVEPGIYIAAGHQEVAQKWWNLGIRVEDDVLVTESGYEVLSAGVPKTIDEIEQLMERA